MLKTIIARLTTASGIAILISGVLFLGGCTTDLTTTPEPEIGVCREDAPWWSVYGYVYLAGDPYEGCLVCIECIDCGYEVISAIPETSESGFYVAWIGMNRWTEHRGHSCQAVAEDGTPSESFPLQGGGPTHYLGPINIYCH